MAKTSEVFTSKYLKVEDLQKKKRHLTIRDVPVEKVGDDEKFVLYFYETEKTFVLNRTNAGMMEMLTGSEESDDWIGTRITLKPDMTSYQGKPTPCIRIDSELPEQKTIVGNNGQAPQPVRQGVAAGAPVDEDDDDSIPF